MLVSRRDFFRTCQRLAPAIGLTALELSRVEALLANPTGPTVLWLEGSGCSGCSVSFLNYFSTTPPRTAAEVLISTVNLAFHKTVMTASGSLAVDAVEAAYQRGGYVLIVEGAVPTALGGATCMAWSDNGKDVTFLEAVQWLAPRAKVIICIGNCAAWGGVPAALPDPTGARGVKTVTLRNTINVAGCPPHPDWMVWTMVKTLAGTLGSLDSQGRPTGLFNRSVHDMCPRRGRQAARWFGEDGLCLKELGCRGPSAKAPCPLTGFNNGVNWCTEANALCIGCVDPKFPGERIHKGVEV